MKVAAVVDRHTVVINRGDDAGIKCGDILCITRDVVDPENGTVLGAYPNVKVKVTEVYPRFCVAETYILVPSDGKRVITVDVGDDVVRKVVCHQTDTPER